MQRLDACHFHLFFFFLFFPIFCYRTRLKRRAKTELLGFLPGVHVPGCIDADFAAAAQLLSREPRVFSRLDYWQMLSLSW